MSPFGRREVFVGAAVAPMAAIQLAKAQPTSPPPQPAGAAANFGEVRRQLVATFPVLERFESSVEQIIRSAFAAPDLTPPWTPNDVFNLAEDVAERVSEILDLRQQLLDLELRAFETAASISLEDVQLRNERAALARNLIGTILEQSSSSASAEAQRYGTEPPGPGFSEQARGRERIANLSLADWNTSGKNEADAVLKAREVRLERYKAALLDPQSAMNFASRHARLSTVLRDAAVEGIGKAACLRVGLQQHFSWEAASPFPVLADDGIIEKLMIWTRSVGRYLETLRSNRYLVRFAIPLTKLPSFGPVPLTAFDTTNMNAVRPFTLNSQHFSQLDDPMLRGVGLQWVSNSVSAFAGEGHRRHARINTLISVPRVSWRQQNPLVAGQIQWATGGQFRFDNVQMMDSEEPERLTHPRFQNVSPVGDWSIQILPNFASPVTIPPEIDVRNILLWVGDLRLVLDLTVKAPAGV